MYKFFQKFCTVILVGLQYKNKTRTVRGVERVPRVNNRVGRKNENLAHKNLQTLIYTSIYYHSVTFYIQIALNLSD